MTEPSHDPMHRVFDELRDADERSAPHFDAVLRQPRRRAHMPRSLHGAALLAAALVAVAVFAVRRSSPPSLAAPLSSWRAPTDVLLRTPGLELLRSVPSIGSSVVDRLSIPIHEPTLESR